MCPHAALPELPALVSLPLGIPSSRVWPTLSAAGGGCVWSFHCLDLDTIHCGSKS